MKFSFDLGAADYLAAGTHLCDGRWYLRDAAPAAFVLTLASGLFLERSFDFAPKASALGAIFLGLIYLFVASSLKKFLFARQLSQFYASDAQQLILGPHTLAVSAEGLESEGPMHRTLRRWPSVSHVCVTRDHLFISTLFGVVYVLPRRATEGLEAVIKAIREFKPDLEVRNA